MKNRKYLIRILGVLVMLGYTAYTTTPMPISIPNLWPKPYYDFAQNKPTVEGFELGRKLFYDPILSRDSSISCASCHFQATGFAHVDHELSHGIDGKVGNRNALALQNLIWSKSFLWDGGVNHLDVQALNPLTHPKEMDENIPHILQKLQEDSVYPGLFSKAFGTTKITGQLLLKALSQFMMQLNSCNAKYDKVMRNETTFTAQEALGYQIFKQKCSSCHLEPLFNTSSFEYNGLAVDPYLNDIGRMKITGKISDSLHFKVPSLRNCQFTAPYMHDGRFKTLTEVVKHYNSLKPHLLLAKQLQKPLDLSDNDRVDLVAFMKTLSDTEFLFNPKYAYPK
ncbi:MAG: cytochrome-c peroxidase [Flavobacterium sp.]|nr:cytochrome-c peroxidase [Flavobacterium sp.]